MVSMRRLLVAATVFCTGFGANAATIVDTGTPSGASFGFNIAQYFAGEFTLSAQTNITSIETYFSIVASVPGGGTVTIQLLNDGGNVPGPTLLYSQSFGVPDSAPLAWRGLSSLDWTVDAGTYWVAFVASGINAVMPGSAPNPMDQYAIWNPASGWLEPRILIDIGARISGDAVSEVPLPAALPLFATILAGGGLVAWRRKRKAAAVA